MPHRTGKDGSSGLLQPTRLHRLTRSALSMAVPLALAAMFLHSTTQAADNWQVEGANGVLHVHGALTESACRLDMVSAWQDITLGDIGTGRLRNLGDRGLPVEVRLRLQDCLPGPARNLDSRSGSHMWSPDQPAISVTFNAAADADNPQLVRVDGAGGLGLRLTDALGRDVRLGDRGIPLLLTPGQNELTYKVTAERTRAPLRVGAYQALLNFGLDYD